MSVADWTSHVYTQCFVNGTWQSSPDAMPLVVLNPYNEKVITEVECADVALAEAAVAAAQQAFFSWAQTPVDERRSILKAWHAAILDHGDAIAEMIMAEGGKVIQQARAEIDYAASFVDWSADQLLRVSGMIAPPLSGNRWLYTIKRPVGVVAAITPWNFPAAMITRKVAPAIAAGCPVVLKPSEDTPLTALLLAKLASDAGLPDGVFNVVVGDSSEIGPVLTTHSDIRAVTFTGSTEVGRLLMQQATSNIKRCGMELGGNAPIMVMADADLDVAADAIVASRFRHTGQTCICANRLLVHASIADDLVKRVVDRVGQLSIEAPDKGDADIGPLIRTREVARLTEWLAEAVAGGANVLCGGHALPNMGPAYFAPTIVTDVPSDCRLATEEIFGPILPVRTFSTIEECIEQANATEYGLAAYCFARDMSVVRRLTHEIEAGMIGINGVALSHPMTPFGGIKQSGLGKEGSQHALDEYLIEKAIVEHG